MDEKTLRSIVESGDADTLRTYIQGCDSILSQALGAQARFAYFHLRDKEAQQSTCVFLATDEKNKEMVTALDDYSGPASTFILQPSEMKNVSNLCTINDRRQSTLCDRRRSGRSICSWFDCFVDVNKWTEDIVEQSLAVRSRGRSSIPAFYEERKLLNFSIYPSSEQVGASRKKLFAFTGSGNSRKGDVAGCKLTTLLNSCDMDNFCLRLNGLGMKEKRARMEIETEFEQFSMETRLWYTSFLKVLKECRDLLKGEFIVRAKIMEEEHSHFKSILSAGIDDLNGCRWDCVRMRWLRAQLTSATILHDWVVLHNASPQQQWVNKDSTENTWRKMSEVRKEATENRSLPFGSEPLFLKFAERTPLLPYVESLTNTPKTPLQVSYNSTAVRPLRARVFPPLPCEGSWL